MSSVTCNWEAFGGIRGSPGPVPERPEHLLFADSLLIPANSIPLG
jgi:hypothetical protein